MSQPLTTPNIASDSLVLKTFQTLWYDQSYGHEHESIYQDYEACLADENEENDTYRMLVPASTVVDNDRLMALLEQMMPTSYRVIKHESYDEDNIRGVTIVGIKRNYRRHVDMIRQLSITVMPASMFGIQS